MDTTEEPKRLHENNATGCVKTHTSTPSSHTQHDTHNDIETYTHLETHIHPEIYHIHLEHPHTHTPRAPTPTLPYLLSNGPGYKVPRSPLSSGQSLHDATQRYLPLQTHLQHTQDLGQGGRGRVHGPKEDKDVVGGGVGQQLEVVGSVLVVGGYVESHQPVEELLAGLVVGEESVPVHMVARTGEDKGLKKMYVSSRDGRVGV